MTTRLLPAIAADTHPPRYRLHKYWSRKPHNVIREFIRAILPTPGLVVDPFVGSGVTAFEAAALGHQVYACDVNPVAVLLSRTTCSPPPTDEFVAALDSLLDELEAQVGHLWRCPHLGEPIRYVVHAIVSRCPNCGLPQTANEAAGTGRSRRCTRCASPIRFNLDSMQGTRVVSYVTVGRSSPITTPDLLKIQQQASARGPDLDPNDPLLANLVENRRILAFTKLTPSDFFTPRALATLVVFRDLVSRLANQAIRDAALLLFTASAAQCSRLTAYRNNLTTGGPAWSVPGFWVPPVHLETNPIIHLHARLRRFKSGLADAAQGVRDRLLPEVCEADAAAFLSRLADRGVRADLVILDPPYGDSVPFVEFSALWNALLARKVKPEADISVSDRLPKRESWRRYECRLSEVFRAASRLLSTRGHVLVTFNNHNLRAWKALLAAAQAAQLRCIDAVYQFPAVIPAKAAFHPKGSYVGDIWAVFVRASKDWRPSADLAPVLSALGRCSAFREGLCQKSLALRVLAITWLRYNLKAELVEEWPAILDSVFAPVNEHLLRWKGRLPSGVPRLADFLEQVAEQVLRDGPMGWKEFYCRVAAACDPYGLPDPAEVRRALGSLVLDGNRVIALSTEVRGVPQQLSLALLTDRN